MINKNAAERAAREAKPLEEPGKKRTRGRKSISVISPAPKDEELPEFDPATFKPGTPSPVVKKGDDEYNIIVQGVKDTGILPLTQTL